MKRRDFIRQGAASALALAANQSMAQEGSGMGSKGTSAGQIPRRPYGKTGVSLSIVGLGGIVLAGEEQAQADRVVAEAVERGVNYFDVAPTYMDAELRLGPALEPYRKDVFLACKTGERERSAAEAEFKRSLERLRTDHFDLYQLHGIADVKKDVDPVFAKGGVMDMLLEAKKAGQIRFLGFSAHSTEAALAALERYDFDSVLFPINFAAYLKGRFGPAVIEKAQQKGVALLALKAMAAQKWPAEHPEQKNYPKCWYLPLVDPAQAELALRWTLSRPITAAVPPGAENLFRLAMECACRFKPVSPEEEARLVELSATLNPVFEAA